MSYFGRLVQQSHLHVDRSADRPTPTTVADAEPAGASVMELEEVMEASVPMAGRLDVGPSARDLSPMDAAPRAIAAESPPRMPAPPLASDGTPSRERVVEGRAPSAPAARDDEPDAPAETSSYDRALGRVLRWVAAGPRPAPAEAEQEVASIIAPPDVMPETRSSVRGDEMEVHEESGRVAPARSTSDVAAGAITAPPARAAGAREATPRGRNEVAADRAPSSPAAPVEEVVQVSIGTISVRIEAPAAPVAPRPASPPPPPRPAPVPSSATAAAPADRAGSRLARRYLHP